MDAVTNFVIIIIIIILLNVWLIIKKIISFLSAII